MQPSFSHTARPSHQKAERPPSRTRLFSLLTAATRPPVSEERLTFALIFIGNCVFWGLVFLWFR